MRSFANRKNLPKFLAMKFVVPVLVMLVGTVTFASIRWIRATVASPGAAYSSVTQPMQQRSTLEAQRITLRPTGFEPAEVTRPAGRFLLAVNDRSGQSDASFILLRGISERLKVIRFRDTPRKHEWREVVNLPAGRYVLVDAANPERICQILLTN